MSTQSPASSPAPRDLPLDQRFQFGKNWSRFLQILDDERIHEAELSLKQMLGMETLEGKRFVDVGCGSGLFSLAARRLGASVHSFDFDPDSVACAEELRRRYFAEEAGWEIERASVLDRDYLQSLGEFDIVYSWGVLHHTGHMWEALENIHSLVATDGKLFLAIYNDQGGASRRWRRVKELYVRFPGPTRAILLAGSALTIWGPTALVDLLRRKPFHYLRNYKSLRGMSPWHDLVDWVGGYPFEVAKPEEIFAFYRERGYALDKITTCGAGLGCNEFVFTREKAALSDHHGPQ